METPIIPIKNTTHRIKLPNIITTKIDKKVSEYNKTNDSNVTIEDYISSIVVEHVNNKDFF